MLLKAHLTSHSMMSGSKWVVTHHGCPGHYDPFLYSSSVYSCHFFLISFAYAKPLLFLSFIVPIFVWNVPLVSLIFLKRSQVFPNLLFSSISLHCSLKNSFLSLPAILWNSTVEYVFPLWDDYLETLVCHLPVQPTFWIKSYSLPQHFISHLVGLSWCKQTKVGLCNTQTYAQVKSKIKTQ